MAIEKLNIVKNAGDVLRASEVMSIVNKVNEMADWINQYEVENPDITSIVNALIVGVASNYTYTGEPIIPCFEVIVGGKVLKHEIDYYYDISNNDGIGTGTISIHGIGKYTGDAEKTFGIDGVKYQVAFISEHGGASKTKISVVTTSNLPIISDPDYDLEGWYYDAEFSRKVLIGDLLEADTTMFAKWVAKTFNVTYNLNGKGEGTIEQPTSKMNKLPELPIPTEQGYKCVGWFYANGTEAKEGDVLTKDVVLKAKWIGTDVVAVINGNQLAYEYDDENCELFVNNTKYIGAIALEGTNTYNYELKYNNNKVNDDITIKTTYDADEDKLSWESTRGNVVAMLNGETVQSGISAATAKGKTLTLRDSNQTTIVNVID